MVAFPTDTVTGLGCRADRPRAVAALFRLKGRAAAKSLIVFVPDLATAERVVGGMAPRVRRLLGALWPGPFTAVLRARRRLPRGLARRGTVGVRVPDHAGARALARRAGPLATTSANRSGEPPARTAAVAAALWPGRVLAVPGRGGRGRPSTVADCTVWPPRVLREGPVTAAALARQARRAERPRK